MISKIVLENFMAHERTELELGPGVTALTGPNNTGKSAIVEGLRCLATNPVPKHYIRHGAKEARVSVELDDGTKVVWIRRKRSSGYELWQPGAEEPEEYWKFGRKPPEDVLKVLRLDLVELETGDPIDVHVGNQREPIFLLNQPGSNAAAFFAASTESAHLLAMQNLLKRRTQDAKRQKREMEGRLSEIQAEMDHLSLLPSIALAIETARELEQSTKKLQIVIPALEKLLAFQSDISFRLMRQSASATILKTVNAPEKLYDVRLLNGLINHVNQVKISLGKARSTGAALASIQVPPETNDTIGLATLCDQLQSMEKRLQIASKRGRSVAGLIEPPRPENTEPLSALMDEMLIVRHRRDRLARWDDVLQSIAEPPNVESDTRLQTLLVDMSGVSSVKRDAETRLTELEKRLQSVKESIAKRVGEIQSCPTCGADLNTEAFLDRRCDHGA